MMLRRLTMLCLMLTLGFAASAAEPSLAPDKLLCEGRSDPAGVDVARPRLAWQLKAVNDKARGLRQGAYQLVAASSLALLGQGKPDLWDSGRVASPASRRIDYAGKPLVSSQTVFWKLRVWDQRGQASRWSAPARFITGVLQAGDWHGARWITLDQGEGQSAQLRREFAVKPQLLRATLHASGLGHVELRLNGAKVGDALLTPGWTDYRKTVLYDTHDVTALIRAGANAIGLTLGNGMYRVTPAAERYTKFAGDMGPQKAIALLRLDYADGSHEEVTTDARWQANAGPIVYSNVYGGEDFDARAFDARWDQSAFGGRWQASTEIAAPEGRLTGLSGAGIPIRVAETLAARATTVLRPGVLVVDFGQNAPLMPRIVVKGEAGARIRITPSELLKPSGEIDDTMTAGKAHWNYTLAGSAAAEQWSPQFFYRGARYLRVELIPTGAGALPELLAITADVVHADAPEAGQFRSSNALFNQIYTLVRWGQRGNMMSVLTDCPQREKLGWLEQTYLNGPALRYNYTLDPLFEKIARDMSDAQLDNGLVPNIAPEYVSFEKGLFRDSAEWGSAAIQMPWQQYLFTGDAELARRHYASMKRYIAYLASRRDQQGLVHIVGALGDWYDIGPKHPGRAQLTPPDLTASAIFYDDLNIMTAFAKLLGHHADAALFAAQAAQLSRDYSAAYRGAGSAGFSTGSQTANAMSLSLGLAAPEQRGALLAAIASNVQEQGLTSGDVGYRYLLRALADGGRSDIVYALNNQSDKPGYGYQLKMGATSLTEAWDAGRGSSQNHFMLGQINEWFFHDLAGIAPDPQAPGFRHVVIRPAIVGDATMVEAVYESGYGKIRSRWQRDGQRITLEVSVPPNTTGTVYLPASSVSLLREGGQPLAKVRGVRLLGHAQQIAELAVEAGNYRFTSALPPAAQ